VGGLSTLVAFVVLFALRVGPEERMMAEQFGNEYAEYAVRTTRLIPHFW
jgi:protein-S-isoprenylcysteine O-methyltransferase Ste14